MRNNSQYVEQNNIRSSVKSTDNSKTAYSMTGNSFKNAFDDTIMVMEISKNENSNIIRSIVVPAYSEEKFIAHTLTSLKKYLDDKNWLMSTEVIVVTADASDKTQQIVANKINQFTLSQHIQPGKKVGKGRDVKSGLSVARGDYILFMDADLATPLKYLESAFEILQKNGGMVIGIRRIHSMHKTILRRVTSVMSNLIVRMLIGWDIPDSQCGFKGFDKKTLGTILPLSKINGWGFDFEFIKIAKINHININKIKIPDWNDPKPEGKGLSGDSQFLAMIKTFNELFKVKKNQLIGRYEHNY